MPLEALRALDDEALLATIEVLRRRVYRLRFKLPRHRGRRNYEERLAEAVRELERRAST